eukprot:Protomagalhaensia_wolfi_Nauph_80__4849@NODE_507_length_2413_cov_11_655013_g377_i0_p1_GENE_NODE_507_length_2413_cov_11_655013_g377_i0NODE_507_length_2413_cov_11_655013_g377_i0_p1_ORF_typecomplete_len405_score59_28Tht1/PF04163_12/0_00011Apolipoprotein/PF01442_18/0_091Apolipoprotein/PF01442_18/7_6e03Nup88/PF10168_9/0_02460KD_IMP/PF02096_20/12_NODE_507_length_2413_cov_11_655013_g377_i0401215
MMALLMADCHLASRDIQQSLSTTCSFPILRNIDWHVPTAVEDFEYTVIECLKGLTDMNFGVYISFLNHIEVICFHIHAKLWQDRAEHTVQQLIKTTDNVQQGIVKAAHNQERMISNQEETLQQQQIIMADWSKLQTTIDVGQRSLAESFHEIKQDVEQGHQRFQDFFDELFDVFHRVLQFQKSVKAKIFDLQSILVYGGLLVLTQYLTNGQRVHQCRTILFSIFTVMCITEFCIVRASTFLYVVVAGILRLVDALIEAFGGPQTISHYMVSKYDDESSVTRALISWTRIAFIGAAIYIYVRAYMTYRDPQLQLVEAMSEKLSCLQAMIEDRLVDDLVSSQPSTTDLAMTSQSSRSPGGCGGWFSGFKRMSTVTTLENRKRTDRLRSTNAHE